MSHVVSRELPACFESRKERSGGVRGTETSFFFLKKEVRVERFNSNRGDFIVWLMEEVQLDGPVEKAEANLLKVQQYRVNPLMSRGDTVSVN